MSVLLSHSVGSASEADWLMAQSLKEKTIAKAITEVHPGEESEDREQLQISEIANTEKPGGLEGDGNDARIMEEALPDGEHRHAFHDINLLVQGSSLFLSLEIFSLLTCFPSRALLIQMIRKLAANWATSADETWTGSAEATSLFAGSLSHASQFEQIAGFSPDLFEQNTVPSDPLLYAQASESLSVSLSFLSRIVSHANQ
jgi:hypothetical protein